MISFRQRATLSNGRKKAIQPVPCVMRNLKRWNTSSVPVRQLLLTEDTLGDNIVLDELVRIIRNLMMPESNKSNQKFVTEGGKIYVGSKKSTYHRTIPGQNLFGLDDNWKVSADLPGWRNDYPKIISNKGLRPDIVLFSKENSKVILVELTITFESRLEQSHGASCAKMHFIHSLGGSRQANIRSNATLLQPRVCVCVFNEIANRERSESCYITKLPQISSRFTMRMYW